MVKSMGRGVKAFDKSSRKDRDGNSVKNTILLALKPKDCDAVFAKLQFLELPTHTVLNEIGQSVKFIYFINSGLSSILSVMADGKSVEVGLNGKEGFVGLPLVVGFRTSSTRTVMQIAGSGFKMSANDFEVTLSDCPALEKMLQRFSHNMAMQATTIAACNRLHTVDQRLARWLLMSRDRIESDFVPLTQEYLSHMLGTRRASVTDAAGHLQKKKLITYARGVMASG